MDTSTFESCDYSFDSFTFAEGIATESHGQNIILVHKQGWPTRVLLKDFHDGVRYSPAHLAHPELALNSISYRLSMQNQQYVIYFDR